MNQERKPEQSNVDAVRAKFEKWARAIHVGYDWTYHATMDSYEDNDLDSAYMGYKAAARDVPEGWQLVPIEPTKGMIFALDEFADPDSPDDIYTMRGRAYHFYKAMLSAAPKP